MGMLSCVEWLGWDLVDSPQRWLSSGARPHTSVIPAYAGIQYAAAHRLIHWRLWNTGSPACAGDGSRRMTHLHDLAARFARGLPPNFSPSRQRAQGMPGARCTRGLACNRQIEAHTSIQGSGGIRHSLRNGLRLISCSPRSGRARCHRRLADTSATLDASIGASGPHDFTVRIRTVRQRHIRVHRIPSRACDDRETPLVSGRDENAILLIWAIVKSISENQKWMQSRK